ncbi:MAG: ABC transporter ATP-binding protein, partial [Micromonosporaceae bacterium]
MSSSVPAASVGMIHTVRRGLALSPELATGLAGTLGLALFATIGRVIVPVAVQQGIDRGIRVPGGP